MTTDQKIWKLQGSLQHYAWGKPGSTSAVAALYHGPGDASLDPNKPYAELWWGTHPSGEASVKTADNSLEKLSAHIARLSPSVVLGAYSTAHWGSQLPFLLKVLSINKALSIQAHPDKALAERLHRDFPTIYTDPNHKPEIAIALTPFEAMSGFRSSSEIVANLHAFPEFKAVLGSSASDFISVVTSNPNESHKEALKALFQALMTADAALASTQLTLLMKRIESSSDFLSSKLKQIHSDYPGDPGVFCLLLLNVITLQPGDALYMGPNDPHAYFKGDCVECMATSDNVVRAGLTPKFKDVQTLVNMLTYHQGTPFVLPLNEIHGVARYAPPTSEFELKRIQLMAGESKTVDAQPGPSVILIAKGSGTFGDAAYSTGGAYLAYAETALRFQAKADSLIFIATTSNSYKLK